MRLYENENESEKRYPKATVEAQFIGKLINTETNLKKRVVL